MQYDFSLEESRNYALGRDADTDTVFGPDPNNKNLPYHAIDGDLLTTWYKSNFASQWKVSLPKQIAVRRVRFSFFF